MPLADCRKKELHDAVEIVRKAVTAKSVAEKPGGCVNLMPLEGALGLQLSGNFTFWCSGCYGMCKPAEMQHAKTFEGDLVTLLKAWQPITANEHHSNLDYFNDTST